MNHTIIFDSQTIGEDVPAEFNAVKIVLDGKMQAHLDWSSAKRAALVYREKGLKIFWEMDLGLFDRLTLPLSNQTQFLSLCLSLEHFRDAIWKEFQEESIGISLYRGSADYRSTFPWDTEQVSNFQGWLQDSFKSVAELKDEANIHVAHFSDIHPLMLSSSKGQHLLSLFCRDVNGEYLDLLANRFPGNSSYLILDDSTITSPMLKAQLLTKERYPRLNLGLIKQGGHQRQLAFQEHEEAVKLGICLPAMSFHRFSDYENLEEVLQWLQGASLRYRIIPESQLTTEWDGLDDLFVVSRSLGVQGRRKLQGFCAAGGIVVTLGSKMGLAQELSFEEWRGLQKNCLIKHKWFNA